MTTSGDAPAPSAATALRRWTALVFVGALAVRLAFVVANPPQVPVSPDKVDRYDSLARHLLAGDGFVLGSSPSAISPPAYPLLIAATYALTGPSQTASRVVLGALDAGTCALFFVLAWRLFSPTEAALTAVALAVSPYQIYLVLTAGSDTLFLFFLAATLVMLAGAMASGRRLEFFATGVALALATLTRATSLLLPVALVAAIVVVGRDRRRAVRWCAAMVVAFALTLAPWTIRNAVHFHRFIPVQTLGGLHLLLATSTTEQQQEWKQRHSAGHPSASGSMNDASMYRRALGRIADEPLTFARLVAQRLVTMWYASHSNRLDPFLAPLNLALLGLAAAGAWLQRRRWRELLPLLAVVLYFVAVHSTMYVIFRYLMPVVPILTMLASVPVARVLARVHG